MKEHIIFFVFLLSFFQLCNVYPQDHPHVFIKPKLNQGPKAMTSASQTSFAWDALKSHKYEQAIERAEKCIHAFTKMAKQQQSSLNEFPTEDRAFDYWALNDVATCLFIKGMSLSFLNRSDKAKHSFQTIIDNYSYARCWDPLGWFWKVADGARDQIITLEKGIDFGDYRSETLTVKAWDSFLAGDHEAVSLYTIKCIELYEKIAIKMQSSLDVFAPKEKAFDYWALNDVATCLFIRAKSLHEQGKRMEAKIIYKEILENYTFSQCWDPKGFFWKISDAAENELKSLIPSEKEKK